MAQSALSMPPKRNTARLKKEQLMEQLLLKGHAHDVVSTDQPGKVTEEKKQGVMDKMRQFQVRLSFFFFNFAVIFTNFPGWTQ
jgi:hypothetical protein